jgi:predicted Zn-dependent protease
MQRTFLALLLASLWVSSLLPHHAMAQSAPASTASSTPLALPQLGDGADMSLAAERRLGDRIARELYRDPDYLEDAVLQDYVQSLWQPLLEAARQRGDLTLEMDQQFAWQILLGRDRSVNAFALPGGYFGLHLGLLSNVSYRDELASVLAHELSHVTQRHISRLILRQNQQAPWLMGAMILGVLAASKNPGAANAAIVGGQAIAAQNQLNFSRDMEREADRVGFGILSQAGFAPEGFVSMFAKLQQASRLNDSGGFPYLRSHPLTTERISDMQNRLPQANATAPADARDMLQMLMAARAKVLSEPSTDSLQAWGLQAKDPRFVQFPNAKQAGILYGAAFAALKMHDFAAAEKWLAPLSLLTENAPETLRIERLLSAEIAIAQSDGKRALLLLPSVSLEQRRPEVLLQSQAWMQSGQRQMAVQQLQTWLADHPNDASAWQWLARAHHTMGRKVASIRAEAEVNRAQLNYADALLRLQAAQEWGRNAAAADEHIEASVVDTRIKQLQQLMKEQALER